MRKILFGLTLAAALVLVGCGSARSVWTEVIRKCAGNDLLGPNVLYFGPSNADGPGTVFQAFESGGTQESHLPAEYMGHVEGVIAPYQAFTCSGSSATSFSFGTNIPVETTLPVSGSIGVQLKRATNVTVSVDSLAWVSLVTGPYRDLLLALDVNNGVRKDITERGHMVLTRALNVKGMKAELAFTSDVGADVKEKIPDISGAGSIAVTASWEGTTKLTILAPADFYIAGELRRWERGGLKIANEIREIGPLVPKLSGIRVRRIDR